MTPEEMGRHEAWLRIRELADPERARYARELMRGPRWGLGGQLALIAIGCLVSAIEVAVVAQLWKSGLLTSAESLVLVIVLWAITWSVAGFRSGRMSKEDAQ